MADAVETCANCGRTIGDQETAHVWRDEVVCSDCHPRLDEKHKAKMAVGGHFLVLGVVIALVALRHYIREAPAGDSFRQLSSKVQQLMPYVSTAALIEGIRAAHEAGADIGDAETWGIKNANRGYVLLPEEGRDAITTLEIKGVASLPGDEIGHYMEYAEAIFLDNRPLTSKERKNALALRVQSWRSLPEAEQERYSELMSRMLLLGLSEATERPCPVPPGDS